MRSRTLVHVLAVVIVAIAIYFFPEFRSSQVRAEFEPDESEQSRPENSAAPFDSADSLTGIASRTGLNGRTIAADGAPLSGIPLEVLAAGMPEDLQPSLRERASTESRADGSFEFADANPGDSIKVRGVDFAAVAERKIVRPDESTEIVIVVAPTSPVAGRILGGNGDEIVLFHATHALPKLARLSELDVEVEFERTLRTREDGSFDFGHLPCSDSAWLEVSDTLGRVRQVQVSATGTLQAVIDLR